MSTSLQAPTRVRRRPSLAATGAIASAIASALALSACGTHPVGPNYEVPKQALIQSPVAQGPLREARAVDANGQPLYSAQDLPTHWWRLFDDPKLDALVEQALTHNTDLRVAAANLARVQAAEAEAQAATRPVVHLGGGPSYGHPSGLSLIKPGYEPPNDGYYSASAGISYDLDLTGQMARAIEAAHANAQAAEAARDLVRVNVAAGTARAYAEACSANWRIRAAETSLRLSGEAVNLTERLLQAGRVGAMDASRAKAQMAQIEASLPPLAAARQSALYRLATLTGQLPETASGQAFACERPPRVQQVMPVGDGGTLLKRRPDVREAERVLAAATARIGVSIADRYPKVSFGLSGSSVGYLSRFGHGESVSWGIGPLISWTVPNTGAVDARIAQSEAGAQAAAAHFDGVVLTALRETETALQGYAHELEREAALKQAREEAARVADQARRLYTGGKVAYLESLDADRNLAQAEATLAASQGQLADDQVQLFLALGGGWEP
jgi:NodT family efflux transporter outer membrane factor (OMF) lipoprotein